MYFQYLVALLFITICTSDIIKEQDQGQEKFIQECIHALPQQAQSHPILTPVDYANYIQLSANFESLPLSYQYLFARTVCNCNGCPNEKFEIDLNGEYLCHASFVETICQGLESMIYSPRPSLSPTVIASLDVKSDSAEVESNLGSQNPSHILPNVLNIYPSQVPSLKSSESPSSPSLLLMVNKITLSPESSPPSPIQPILTTKLEPTSTKTKVPITILQAPSVEPNKYSNNNQSDNVFHPTSSSPTSVRELSTMQPSLKKLRSHSPQIDFQPSTTPTIPILRTNDTGKAEFMATNIPTNEKVDPPPPLFFDTNADVLHSPSLTPSKSSSIPIALFLSTERPYSLPPSVSPLLDHLSFQTNAPSIENSITLPLQPKWSKDSVRGAAQNIKTTSTKNDNKVTTIKAILIGIFFVLLAFLLIVVQKRRMRKKDERHGKHKLATEYISLCDGSDSIEFEGLGGFFKSKMTIDSSHVPTFDMSPVSLIDYHGSTTQRSAHMRDVHQRNADYDMATAYQQEEEGGTNQNITQEDKMPTHLIQSEFFLDIGKMIPLPVSPIGASTSTCSSEERTVASNYSAKTISTSDDGEEWQMVGNETLSSISPRSGQILKSRSELPNFANEKKTMQIERARSVAFCGIDDASTESSVGNDSIEKEHIYGRSNIIRNVHIKRKMMNPSLSTLSLESNNDSVESEKNPSRMIESNMGSKHSMQLDQIKLSISDHGDKLSVVKNAKVSNIRGGNNERDRVKKRETKIKELNSMIRSGEWSAVADRAQSLSGCSYESSFEESGASTCYSIGTSTLSSHNSFIGNSNTLGDDCDEKHRPFLNRDTINCTTGEISRSLLTSEFFSDATKSEGDNGLCTNRSKVPLLFIHVPCKCTAGRIDTQEVLGIKGDKNKTTKELDSTSKSRRYTTSPEGTKKQNTLLIGIGNASSIEGTFLSSERKFYLEKENSSKHNSVSTTSGSSGIDSQISYLEGLIESDDWDGFGLQTGPQTLTKYNCKEQGRYEGSHKTADGIDSCQINDKDSTQGKYRNRNLDKLMIFPWGMHVK